MMTGLMHAKGEEIFLTDIDLEEDPENLLIFSSQMQEKKCDVVYGMQNKRRGSWFDRWSGKCFYLIFNSLTGLGLSHDMLTSRIMTKRYVRALVSHQEREIFISGLWHITGFNQVPFLVEKHSTSKTTYTLKKKVSLVVNAIVSFSNIPLKLIFYIGCIVLMIAVLQLFILSR